ncbi:uncharacterized protein LOC143229213 isoform X2 [Tachypleus tridentatus]|uniref:uncharacterized protein LOC143229213 isoform X2 n=1 Tax=Tachypleus tridentatus TaxID=6853 RepID=UPI003FCF1C65
MALRNKTYLSTEKHVYWKTIVFLQWSLMFKSTSLLWFLLPLFLLTTCEEIPSKSQEIWFTGCNRWLTAPFGVISTPNFPRRYPVPIKCQWVLEAPRNKSIAIYFTQFYMREGVRISEYDYYDESITLSKQDLGIVSSDAEPTQYIGFKSFLVLDFEVTERDNVHMRVMDFFLDVYGFNITYEIIDKQNERRRDPCIENHCSFNGVCYASRTFKTYTCNCFYPYYGSECKYSPVCGPNSNDTMCLNGGNCRHYIGSRARRCECPSGYEGVFCERKQQKRYHNRKDSKPRECEQRRCSDLCKETLSSTNICTCPPGQQLTDDFNYCLERERVRYVISFKLLSLEMDGFKHASLDLLSLNTVKSRELKLQLDIALSSLFQRNLSIVENLTVLEFKHDGLVQFHFFGKKDEREQVKTLVEKTVKSGQIKDYRVEPNYFHFEVPPSLRIQHLKASEKLPVTVGSQLTLECIITGSSRMEVKWYKDDFPINKNTSHQRMWTAFVPKNSQDQFTHLLGFDRIDILDAGVFTCEVMEWGNMDKKQIQIYTRAPPQPKLTPLTATVKEGDRIELYCLLQEDASEKFGYTWLKNGEILNPSKEPEIIEDLFRTGSRMVITSIKSSASYTCIVTSSAGRTSRNSIITVLKSNQNIAVCPAQHFKGLVWNLTAVNSLHKLYCPEGFKGVVSRYCNARQNLAEWEDPDFSGCLAKDFIEIRNKFRTLEIGYIQNNISFILAELNWYSQRRAERMYPGEGEPVVDLLKDIDTFLHKQVVHKGQNGDDTEVILDIVSLLLTYPHLIQKQSRLSKIHQLVLNRGLMTPGDVQIFPRDTLVLEKKQVVGSSVHVLSFPSFASQNVNLTQEGGWSSEWLKDRLNLTIDFLQFLPVRENVTVATVFYRNLSLFLPPRILAKRESEDLGVYQLYSRVVGIAMMVGKNINQLKNVAVKIKLSLQPDKETMDPDHIITCGHIDYSQETFQYFLDGCHQITIGKQVVCHCDQIGTFTLLLSSVPTMAKEDIQLGFKTVTGTGCVICISFLCLTLLVLILSWRNISGAITALKIQFTSAVIGFYIIFLRNLCGSLSQEYYPHLVSLLAFLLLGAFCTLLCVVLTVYVEFVNLHTIHHLELKIVAMGWAVPVIVLGATLAAQVPDGFEFESWWLIKGTKFFYSFLSSGSIVIALYILMYITVKTELREHEKVDSTILKNILNRKRLVNCSLCVLIALIVVSSSSIFYINIECVASKYMFALSSAILGLVIFIVFIAYAENRRQICSCLRCYSESTSEKQADSLKIQSNSFKMYVKPEVISNRHHHLDVIDDYPEKRAERIRRMRSEIERTEREKQRDSYNNLMSSSFSDKIFQNDNRGKIAQSGSSMDLSHNNDGLHIPCRFHHPMVSFQDTTDVSFFELQELEGSPRNNHSYDDSTLADPNIEDKRNVFVHGNSSNNFHAPCSSPVPLKVSNCLDESGQDCFLSSKTRSQSALLKANSDFLSQVVPPGNNLCDRYESVSVTEEKEHNTKHDKGESQRLVLNSHSPVESKEGIRKEMNRVDDSNKPKSKDLSQYKVSFNTEDGGEENPVSPLFTSCQKKHLSMTAV